MMILKCKMCGGDIIVNENQTYGTCDSCGSTMTLPKIDDERRANAFNRANHLRRQNDFDKAISAYERILNEDNADAEAHWGIVLSRYGIEYVEDPRTHERIPTCHRVQTNSILADIDYLAAIEHAPDGYTHTLYEEEAKRIFGIQKEILAISDREDPYDVFICYKETNGSGIRTKDSAIAQDVYYQLTNEGYKVFFSRITLEDKLGQQYEPYIFAALNSAKVMVVIGTKREYYEAVWVKNEWLRYLDLMKKDRSKLLIPCYCDMDAYDLPEELSMLQSQDMSKIGFIQDLIRGVKKIMEADKSKPSERATSKPVEAIVAPTVMSLLERGYIFLEDGEWQSANEYFERALDIEPKNSSAYIGKLCAETNSHSQEDLLKIDKPLTDFGNYVKAVKFASPNQKEDLMKINHTVLFGIELAKQKQQFLNANRFLEDAMSKNDSTTNEIILKTESIGVAQAMFESISKYRGHESFSGRIPEERRSLIDDIIKNASEMVSTCEKYIYELKEKKIVIESEEKAREEALRNEQRISSERKRIEEQRRRKSKHLFIAVLIVSIVVIFAVNFPSIKDFISGDKLTDISKASVGDIVSYGSYEQDNNLSNGKEEILWRVIEKNDSTAMLISKQCLDCLPYNTYVEDCEWEICSLREWLNKTFAKTAFNLWERSQIIPMNTLETLSVPYLGNNPNSQDKVFILSTYELEYYLRDKEARLAEPSVYAVSQNELAVNAFNHSPWWLRSTRKNYFNVTCVAVNELGALVDTEITTDSSTIGVRPVIVVNLH